MLVSPFQLGISCSGWFFLSFEERILYALGKKIVWVYKSKGFCIYFCFVFHLLSPEQRN